MTNQFSKWVACWGNATSITDRKESVYAKDLTLRYPIRICFSGNRLRFHFSNLTGTEPVTITAAFVAKKTDSHSNPYQPIPITFAQSNCVGIPSGTEILSDEIGIEIIAGEMVEVSLYFADYTQMNSGTLITGPLSTGKYSYGNYAQSSELPANLTRSTNWFYFLNTIDIFT
ncbi:MAG: lipase, partial [Fibrobacteraceae bacterium]|nr:lipase [Fibrobacteraceae bacterium]